MSANQLEGGPAARKAQRRPDPTRYPLIVRQASCYCVACREGRYTECVSFRSGFGDFVCQRTLDFNVDRQTAPRNAVVQPAVAPAVGPSPVPNASVVVLQSLSISNVLCQCAVCVRPTAFCVFVCLLCFCCWKKALQHLCFHSHMHCCMRTTECRMHRCRHASSSNVADL